MAVKIQFDTQNNAITPTLLLATKGGKIINALPAHHITFKDTLNSGSEMNFDIYKNDCDSQLWDNIVDFKLVWAKEWNKVYEIQVETNEADEIKKNVKAISLGESELSQILVFGVEINTEDDIARDDYKSTVFFNETDPSHSLLHRITDKAPHYNFKEKGIDKSLIDIQRTFSFDNETIYDVFQDIAEEIGCLFIINCYFNSSLQLVREIEVRDLESNCQNEKCKHRGEFENICPECGGTQIEKGYGKDTTIFISKENLTDDITYTTNIGSVKNCFKLEAGDDLMTATIKNCNPNGSDYIWYFSDELRKDMSEELRQKLTDYDKSYKSLYSTSVQTIKGIGKYNKLVSDYNDFTTKNKGYEWHKEEIPESIKGFKKIIEYYYDTIDFELYLTNSFMPSVTPIEYNSSSVTAMLKEAFGKVSVSTRTVNLNSSTAVDNAVLAMAKVLVSEKAKITAVEREDSTSSLWRGRFIIGSLSEDGNEFETDLIEVPISSDYVDYVNNKMTKVLAKYRDDATDTVALFNLESCNEEQFKNQLKKYSLSRLSLFHDSCQGCLDLLIEEGYSKEPSSLSKKVVDKNNKEIGVYEEIYLPFFKRLNFISDEMVKREKEINIIKDAQSKLLNLRNSIQRKLSMTINFPLVYYKELISYRREDVYKNDNYISDGLDNAQLIQMANKFIEVAQKEIIKSATLQHSISSNLKNLLVIKEFKPIIDYFEVGNWLRIKIDDQIYILRLIEYEINFDDLENINVEFSDVKSTADGLSDLESIMNQASSMATSYSAVTRQAEKGEKGNKRIEDWIKRGLSLSQTKIVDSAINQDIVIDSHGILGREYLPLADTYDKKQLKIINKGLYLTDDGWEHSRAGIGDFIYFDPETEQYIESYGVVADTLIGQLILGEKVKIYNQSKTIKLDDSGFSMVTYPSGVGKKQTVFDITRDDGNGNREKIFYINDEGNVVIRGTLDIYTGDGTSLDTRLNNLYEESKKYTNNKYTEYIEENERNFQGINTSIESSIGTVNGSIEALKTETNNRINDVQGNVEATLRETGELRGKINEEIAATLGQYLTFNNKGLTIGAIKSPYKTYINNFGIQLKYGDVAITEIQGNQMNVPNAAITNSLSIHKPNSTGKYVYVPKTKGGYSIVWVSA